MFGSTNPFGQSSSSPFGTSSVFGGSNASNNPFTPKPFGSTTPFGSQTGGSIFGGTSTGVFGAAQSSSPLGSTPGFGASSTPTFGSSAFGASSTPAFGSSSSSFGGSSIFGQKPAIGGFGSTTGQTSPFGSTLQQSQPAFGSSLFGSSTPFGAASTPTFVASSAPAFGASSTAAFGATTTPAFGVNTAPTFGSTSTPTFGNTGSVFGSSSTPGFGSSATPAFGASSAPVFGSSSVSAFGSSSTPAFGASSTPPFGASSTPSFNFGSSPTFGQSSSAFGSTPFGTTPFGAQSSPFGAQSTTTTFGNPGFGQSGFGSQRGGSRVAPYAPTAEVDGGSGTQPAGKLESTSAMPAYKDKSHEELRWEDYQLGDKGGPNPAGQPASGIGFSAPAQSNLFGTTSTFAQTSANPFSSTTSTNPFASKTPTFGSTGFGSSPSPSFSSPFGTSASPFGTTTSSTTPSLFGATTTPAFGASSSPSLFGGSSTPAFGASSSPSIFGSASAPGSSPAFGSGLTFGNTQASGLFQSSSPLGQTASPAFGSGLTFGNTQASGLFQSSTPLGQTASGFGSTAPAFGQTTSSTFGQPNPFGTPSTGFGGNLFSSSSTPSLLATSTSIGFGQTMPSLSSPFSAPTQTSGAFSFGNFGQPQFAPSSGFGGVSNNFGQGAFGQYGTIQSNWVPQPVPVSNPFGTLPAMPQMSIGRAGSSSSIQYGISNMPVADKPAPVRVSSLLTTRHLSQRRTKLPPRKYHPKTDGPKIPFFSDEEEAPSTPKADALFIPRENPRALVIRPMEPWASRASAEKSVLKDVSTPIHENGKSSGDASPSAVNGIFSDDGHDKIVVENGFDGQHNTSPARPKQKANGVLHEDHGQKGESYISLSGHRAGEAAIVYEHGADIEALMPKLRHADYYSEPRIQELAAKERAEPGYCRHVKDFVVGRHGYGSIKFLGETDVRRLDLEALVQFNNKEVIVYMDESKKPPVGQGLNKPAEVTLLNIKCFNKKTGQQYTDGPNVEKYKDMLKKKAGDQGAEFVSYDPVKGEWKFRVSHFSRYELGDEAEDDPDSFPVGAADVNVEWWLMFIQKTRIDVVEQRENCLGDLHC
ncbi:nuclear pore complex protein NUP98A-like [Aristolochia californica]|uniref:nuclear pore complex protein NUP98A-like n=1 Tax=Aristolochia californica TaxID=171875 RepID=UPI0035DDB197